LSDETIDALPFLGIRLLFLDTYFIKRTDNAYPCLELKNRLFLKKRTMWNTVMGFLFQKSKQTYGDDSPLAGVGSSFGKEYPCRVPKMGE
jgi:hypothetical protein